MQAVRVPVRGREFPGLLKKGYHPDISGKLLIMIFEELALNFIQNDDTITLYGAHGHCFDILQHLGKRTDRVEGSSPFN
jgi:hypothetical protein